MRTCAPLALKYLLLSVQERQEERKHQKSIGQALTEYPLQNQVYYISPEEQSMVDGYYWFQKFLQHCTGLSEPVCGSPFVNEGADGVFQGDKGAASVTA